MIRVDDAPSSTRARILAALASAVFLGGTVLLLAQEFHIKQVKMDASGQVAIQYESDPNARFTLLSGSTVTNITTPVATSPGQAGPVEFTTLSSATNSATFYRVLREESGPADSTITTITGTVLDTNGAPVFGATVAIFSLDVRVQTDASGRFSLPQVPSSFGSLVVTVELLQGSSRFLTLVRDPALSQDGVTELGNVVLVPFNPDGGLLRVAFTRW